MTKREILDTLDEAADTLRLAGSKAQTIADEEYLYEVAQSLDNIGRTIAKWRVK